MITLPVSGRSPNSLNTAPRQHIFAVSGKSNFLSVLPNAILGKTWYMTNKCYYQFRLGGVVDKSTDAKNYEVEGKWSVEGNTVIWDARGHLHRFVFHDNYTKFVMIRLRDKQGYTGQVVQK